MPKFYPLPISTPDDALRAAVERWLPGPEDHEVAAIREQLRSHGYDVQPIRKEAE